MAISRNYRILIFGEVFKINTTHFSWNSFNVHFAVLLTLLILQQLCCLYMLLRLTEKQDKYCVDTDLSSNSTADCGALPLPVNGFLLPPYTNTTEGSVAAFQCDSGFVPEGVMTAVCESDGQWTPNSGNVTCSRDWHPHLHRPHRHQHPLRLLFPPVRINFCYCLVQLAVHASIRLCKR